MILFDNDSDPAMRYEGLVRAVFKCDKWGDPFKYATHDRYNRIFAEEIIAIEAKRTLSTVIIKIIIDNEQSEYIDKLIQLDDKVWTSSNQEDMIKIIDECIAIIDKIEKY